MDTATARQIAHYSHLQERDRYGEPRIEHVERVAAAVPPEAQTIAFLHDVLEWTITSIGDLRAAGLTQREQRAIELLTREPGENFELHAARVAAARGPDADLARVVRLADLDDHISRRRPGDDTPPYAWARRRISVAHDLNRSVAGAA